MDLRYGEDEVGASSSSFPLIPLLSPPCILGFLREKFGFGAEDGGEGTVVFSGRERMNERK